MRSFDEGTGQCGKTPLREAGKAGCPARCRRGRSSSDCRFAPHPSRGCCPGGDDRQRASFALPAGAGHGEQGLDCAEPGTRNPNSAPDSIRGFGTTRIRYAVAAKRRAAPYRPAGGRAARHYMRRCASAISSQVRTWISHARARPLRSWVNHWTRAGVDAVAAFMMTSGLVPRGKPVLYGSLAALQQAIPFLQQIGCDRAPRPPSQATSRRIRPAFS